MSASPAPLLIGLVGYAHSGKDSVAQHLCDRHSFVQLAFANQLREIAVCLGDYCLLGEPFDTPDAKERAHGAADGCSYTSELARLGYEQTKATWPAARKFLVDIGHGFRSVFGASFWVDQVERQLTLNQNNNIVVSDCRYKNECDMINSHGGIVIYLERPGCGPANPTEAESISDIRDSDVVDLVLGNNGTLQNLYNIVDYVLGVGPIPSDVFN